LSKATAEDAGAYRTWVLAVGQQVAEAAKDGGVLASDQVPERLVAIAPLSIDSGVFV
jgi:hypothetical protein